MTAEVVDRPIAAPADWELVAPARRPPLDRLAILIGGALLAVILYAAFDHGAVGLAPGARIALAVGAIAAVGAAAGLGLDALRFRASPAALTGLALLVGFACWSGVTVIWSVAPDQTWVEFNRALTYAVVVALGVAIGASQRRAVTLVALGYLFVAAFVALYALAQKLVPGLRVTGVFDLNQTGSIPRLQAPIGYWNALALFLVLAVPSALHFTVDSTRSPGRRLIAGGVLELLFLSIALTLSRGGLIALAVALIVGVTGSAQKLRALAWLALVALATVPPLVLGLALHSLASAGAALGSRETGGAILAAVLLASLAGLFVAGRGLLKYEPRLRFSPGGARRARQISVVGAGGVVVGAVVVAILSHAWHHFTSPSAPSNFSPSRLLTTDSYRWLWWKEAARAFAARPVGGWGAGSFGVVHLIYRHNALPVQQPHSVPLQFLSETGVIGAGLGLGGLGLLLAAAVRSARRRELTPGERAGAMAILAAAIAYAVHFLYDWDWNIPAVTLPALLFVGVLAGAGHGGEALRRPLGLGSRALAVTSATLWLCLFAVSAILPSLAASDANAALIDASSPSQAALQKAEAEARRSSSLNPLSDAGLRVETSIALRRGELTRARYYLERALGRAPSDELAWNELALLDARLGDRAGARDAAHRVVALDPYGPAARALRRANLAGFGR